LASLAAVDAPSLIAFLRDQGLAPLWWELLRTWGEPSPFADTLREDLKQDRFGSAAAYLAERRTLQKTAAVLDAALIPHGVFKGAQLREILYATPALRPVVDIDVLVPQEERYRAIACLVAAGMTPRVAEKDLSHEIKLKDGSVSVDLHWHLFRPGRSRVDLAPALLDRRRENGGIWTLDDSAALLVMLVHPAFVKHVNSDAATLVRLVELDRMLRLRAPDWEWVLRQIEKAGLRTAAWSTLHWLHTFFDTPVPEPVSARLRPGRLHRAYLRLWIDRHLPARLQGLPLLVQGAFTLALHDHPADALRAVAAALRARRQGPRLHREILRVLETGEIAMPPKRRP
jgi:hypothetical protein